MTSTRKSKRLCDPEECSLASNGDLFDTSDSDHNDLSFLGSYNPVQHQGLATTSASHVEVTGLVDGLARRRPGRFQKVEPTHWETHKSEIRQLYLSGKTLDEIRKHMKMSRGFKAR